MFPIGDDNTQRRTLPVVTYVLIALNVLFFLVELSGGDQFIEHWAFIPARFARDHIAGLRDHLHFNVHAWQLVSSVRKHAVPVDFR